MEKITTLEAKVAELEGRLAAGTESTTATAAAMEEQQAELEHLREGLTVLGAELEQMTEEKGRLEEEYQRFQAGLQSSFPF
jgi:predicted nuclease with TOPRIM domain